MQRFVIAVAAILALTFGTPAFADEPIIINFSSQASASSRLLGTRLAQA